MTWVVALLLLNADAGWKVLSQADGYVLECRAVKDSAYFEYRVSTETELGVRGLCDGIFEYGTFGRRAVLEDTGDVRVIYDQVKVPGPVAPRDLAFTMRRVRRPDGSCRIEVALANDRAPPVEKGWVRLSKLRSRWQFEPTQRGARVTYWLFSEPGGSVPAVFAHGAQREAALSTVKEGLTFVRSGPPKVK